MFSSDDFQYMRRALELAELGMYITTPNPRVGCVIVRDGEILGEGYTQPAGHNHAEVEAIADARARGHRLQGATAYVTLEPCSHYGRTPPCVHAVLEAGISRVIAAMEDPNTRVAGQGLEQLRLAGLDVRCGLMANEAREMNIGFVTRMMRGTPWVRAKTAVSLDGHTNLHNGASQWITGSAARADGHAWRARACAILTGIGTVRSDDPTLTVREVVTPRQPPRILVDSRLEIDLDSKLVRGGNLTVVSARRDPGKEQELIDRGCEVLHLPNEAGKVDLVALMRELGRREINELHVEAGSKLNGALIRDGCVDELLIYMAPALLGDAPAMFDLPAIESLDGRYALQYHDVERVGADLRILARFGALRVASERVGVE